VVSIGKNEVWCRRQGCQFTHCVIQSLLGFEELHTRLAIRSINELLRPIRHDLRGGLARQNNDFPERMTRVDGFVEHVVRRSVRSHSKGDVVLQIDKDVAHRPVSHINAKLVALVEQSVGIVSDQCGVGRIRVFPGRYERIVCICILGDRPCLRIQGQICHAQIEGNGVVIRVFLLLETIIQPPKPWMPEVVNRIAVYMHDKVVGHLLKKNIPAITSVTTATDGGPRVIECLGNQLVHPQLLDGHGINLHEVECVVVRFKTLIKKGT